MGLDSELIDSLFARCDAFKERIEILEEHLLDISTRAKQAREILRSSPDHGNWGMLDTTEIDKVLQKKEG